MQPGSATPRAFEQRLLRRAQRECAVAMARGGQLGDAVRFLVDGDREHASQLLQHILADKQPPASAFYFRGVVGFLEGFYDEAASDFSRAIDRGFRPPEVVHALADALFLLARFDEAVQAYDIALSRQASAEGYARKGRALTELGREDDAVAAFKESLRLKLTTVSSMDGMPDVDQPPKRVS